MAESSMLDVLAAYEAKGYTGQFGAEDAARVRCHGCGAVEPAAQTPVLAMHRLEGASDPSDQSVVAALECVACGAHGTLVLSYGPEASREDGAVLRELLDDRDQGGIMAGM